MVGFEDTVGKTGRCLYSIGSLYGLCCILLLTV